MYRLFLKRAIDLWLILSATFITLLITVVMYFAGGLGVFSIELLLVLMCLEWLGYIDKGAVHTQSKIPNLKSKILSLLPKRQGCQGSVGSTKSLSYVWLGHLLEPGRKLRAALEALIQVDSKASVGQVERFQTRHARHQRHT